MPVFESPYASLTFLSLVCSQAVAELKESPTWRPPWEFHPFILERDSLAGRFVDERDLCFIWEPGPVVRLFTELGRIHGEGVSGTPGQAVDSIEGVSGAPGQAVDSIVGKIPPPHIKRFPRSTVRA